MEFLSIVLLCALIFFLHTVADKALRDKIKADELGQEHIKNSNESKERQCPPHRWFQNQEGKMLCDVCRITPSYEGRE